MCTAGCESSDSEPGPKGPSSKAFRILELTPEFFTVSGVEQSSEYTAGERVTLTLLPGEMLPDGFSQVHMEHILIHVNDMVYMPSLPADESKAVESVAIEIEIPDRDFEVVACYSVQQQLADDGHTMRLEPHEEVSLYGISPQMRYKYFDCYLLTPDAYTITDMQFRVGDGSWHEVNGVKGCSFRRSERMANVYRVTIRPDYQNVEGDVTLRVEGEQHGRYAIEWVNATAALLDMEKSVFPTESIDGEVVTAELWINNGHYLDSASASVEGVTLELINRAYIRFVMPTQDVKITLNILEEIPVTCTESEHVQEATFYDADDIYYGVPTQTGIPGESVFLFASATEGFKPMTALIGSGERFPFQHYAYAMFVAEIRIPEGAEALNANVETAKAYEATSTSNSKQIVFNNGNLYAEGETVSMSIFVPEGERIVSVKAVDAHGTTVPLTLDLPYASFIMPASDVDVSVVYEKLNGGTASVIAYFDEERYGVSSSTNYDWDFAQGFTIERGATFFLSVYDYENSEFWVGVKIGDTVSVYAAQFNDMMGEYSFDKALVADGDVVIKVGGTEDSVAF